jgi:dipeptidyl aminopeptidase/acylaminoacyl peptidase
MRQKNCGLFALAALSLALALVGSSTTSAAPPIEAYGQLPTVQEMDLSPDGEHLAVLAGDGAGRRIQILSTSDLNMLATAPLDTLKVRGMMWAGPNHLIILYSQTADVWGLKNPSREWLLGADYDLKLNQYYPLIDSRDRSELQYRSLNAISGAPIYRRVNGKDMVYFVATIFQGRIGVRALFERDLNSRRVRQVEVGGLDTLSWLLDDYGVPMARVDYDQRGGRWTLNVKTHRGWTKAVTEVALLDPPALRGLGRDGQSMLVEIGEKDHRVVKSVSLADGRVADTDLSPTDVLVDDPKTRALIGAVTPGELHFDYHFYAPSDQALWDSIAKGFGGETVTLKSWSDDRMKAVVKAEGSKYGDGFFLVDQKTHTAKGLADEYKDVWPDDIAPVKFFHYPAADGTSIPAYLTLPQGRPARALPLVVLVHGGPEARDEPGFDWLSQAIASRGYAVLRPQFRGSSGFGAAFVEAGYGQWGKKMQTDVSDGVRELVKSGVVDPKRVCIAGWSYGGYAALAGAVFDSAAYRCALDMAGPSDLRLMLDEVRDKANGYNDSLEMRYWSRFMGVKTPGDRNLDDISPARHADQAAIPILIVHGVDDTVVRYEQSKRMAEALKRAGKPYEFVTLNGEDHWGSRGETRLQLLQAWIKFLEAHNPPDPPIAAAAPKVASAAVAH